MLDRFASAVKNKSNRIKISISCGRSTDYTEEYWIEDMDGKHLHPWEFPSEWRGKVFQFMKEKENQAMIYIAEEDTGKFQDGAGQAISALGKGVKRIDLDVDLGDQLNPVEIVGYWVGDIMRIDIKLKE